MAIIKIKLTLEEVERIDSFPEGTTLSEILGIIGMDRVEVVEEEETL